MPLLLSQIFTVNARINPCRKESCGKEVCVGTFYQHFLNLRALGTPLVYPLRQMTLLCFIQFCRSQSLHVRRTENPEINQICLFKRKMIKYITLAQI